MLPFVLFLSILAQNNTTCPVCFNCIASGCKNFGTCNGLCQCPDGFGDVDCGKPTCGGINMVNQARPIRTEPTCKCSDGFTGPNCNVCNKNDACSGSQGAVLGSQIVCNQSPLVWKSKHASYCQVNNSLVSTVFSGGLSITMMRDLKQKSTLATLWNKDNIQLSCNITECAQTNEEKNAIWKCQNIKCSCIPGTVICGGGGFLDLSSQVNSASGGAILTCPKTGASSCTVSFDFLSALFPDGLSLSPCNFGECANSLDAPGALDTQTMNQLSVAGIAGISLAATILGFLLICLLFSFRDLYQRKHSPERPSRKGEVISFEHVCYEVKNKRILKDISGSVKPGQILAIMGPSGAGKTSLLDILAKKVKNGKVLGKIRFGETEIGANAFRGLCGFVDQEDTLLSTMTVREAIGFSAKLRLPDNIPIAEKMNLVDDIIKKLRLSHISNTVIGDSLTRGISGGEKRRVSIGIELVTNPCVLFLDEPTSGLDSYNASEVMQTLASLAHEENKTIIFTVHQPRSDIFAMFDLVLLLTKGKTLYFGSAANSAEFCKNQGNPCPEGYNTADHLLDLASGKYGFKEGEDGALLDSDFVPISSERTSRFSIARNGSNIDQELGSTSSNINDEVAIEQPRNVLNTSFITQLGAVLGRSWTHFWRKPSLFFSHFIASVFLGTILGFIYFRVDNSLAGIQNRLGSLFFLQSLMGFAGLSALTTFSSERVLFIRERSNGFYGPLPFVFSKILFDLIPLRIIPSFAMCSIAFFLVGYSGSPEAYFRFIVVMLIFSCNCALFCLVIGCIINDFSTATLTASILMLFQMLFAGILVNQVQIPIALRWIQYLSLFKYAYEAAAANDAAGVKVVANIGNVDIAIPAATILTSFGIDVNAYSTDVAISIGIMFLLIVVIATLVTFRLVEKR